MKSIDRVTQGTKYLRDILLLLPIDPAETTVDSLLKLLTDLTEGKIMSREEAEHFLNEFHV